MRSFNEWMNEMIWIQCFNCIFFFFFFFCLLKVDSAMTGVMQLQLDDSVSTTECGVNNKKTVTIRSPPTEGSPPPPTDASNFPHPLRHHSRNGLLLRILSVFPIGFSASTSSNSRIVVTIICAILCISGTLWSWICLFDFITEIQLNIRSGFPDYIHVKMLSISFNGDWLTAVFGSWIIVP